MGILDKIENKLSGNKDGSTSGSTTDERNRLQKQQYSSSETEGSSLQNPISSSGGRPTGTAVSSNTQDIGREGYGTQQEGYGTGREGYTSTTGREGLTSTTGREGLTSSTGREGYTSTAGREGLTSTTGREGYSTGREGYGAQQPTGYEGHTTTNIHPSGTSTGRDQYGTTDDRSYASGAIAQDPSYQQGSRQYIDPTGTSSRGYGTSGTADYSKPATKDTFSSPSGGYDRDRIPASNQPLTDSSGGISSGQGQNYGRDATMVGGAGAAGYGASELRQGEGYQPTGMQYSRDDPRYAETHARTTDQPGYMSRENYGSEQTGYGGGMPGTTGTGMAGGLGSSGGEGLPDHKKMGSAYEAGYKDAMEHMKAEQGGVGKRF